MVKSQLVFLWGDITLPKIEFEIEIVCFYHVTYTFQSESTLYSCLNVKELLAWNRREIWNLSDCNWTRTHNHLGCKQTLYHLVKLAKWLSCVVSTYLYGTFDCVFLSCHVRVSNTQGQVNSSDYFFGRCQGDFCKNSIFSHRYPGKWH